MKVKIILEKFDEVDDVILADGNFENRSMHNRICLFFPQVVSNGLAKSRFNSSLGSERSGSSLV